MNSKLIEYLNKTRNGKKDNIRAILFSEDTLTYYYLFDINMENKEDQKELLAFLESRLCYDV